MSGRSPAWFRRTFQEFVGALVNSKRTGQVSIDDGADDLWDKMRAHSERQVADALADLFGERSLPILLSGGIVHRTKVEDIANLLVNRGLVTAEEPKKLLPEKVMPEGGYHPPGQAWEERQPPDFVVGGRVPAENRALVNGSRRWGGRSDLIDEDEWGFEQ